MLKYIYISLGLITLTLGLLGIITPGLPTTPFILLTAFLFAKGSPQLHKRLLNNKLTGHYINRVSGGLSVKARIISIAFMWCMVCITAFLVFDYGKMRFIMIGLGVIGTIAQLIVLRKRKAKVQPIEVEIQNSNIERTAYSIKAEATANKE
ncbi:YbaN family protein [Dysgonomonas sp. ZJ279]|uniref:YbaN family protein n=1 Tax=Dysgonomonas sp. ZJ279 TaxID=2709796 RepID=UPI0021029390|nr:YbaN family protein [Dysgonomonas sp. ZJ279]